MYCPNCHNHIDDNSVFCKFCGTKQMNEQRIELIFAYKDRTIKKKSGLPEDSYFCSWTYFLNENRARASFKREYTLDIQVAASHPEYTIHPIQLLKSDGYSTNIDEIHKGSLNLLDNLVEYYDQYHLYNGKTYHDRHELYAVKCQPAFTINPNLRNNRIIAFVYEEYVVLNDSDDNHKGYVYSQKLFSDSDAAIQQLRSDVNSFSAKVYNATTKIVDKRNGFDFHDDEAMESSYYYTIFVYKDGHRIRHFSVEPVVLR